MPFTEKSTVENYIVGRLQEMGWEFKKADELERESYEEPLLIKNLVRAIKRINKNLDLTDDDISYLINELKFKHANVEGIKSILWYLKNGVPKKLEKEKILRYVKLIDHENIENNEVIVTRQVTFESAEEKIIPDIVLYVNGIPLVVIECKSPVDPDVSWVDAYKQIKRYEREVPEVFKYVQFSFAAADTTKYFPNVPWSEETHIYTWREKEFDILESSLEMLLKTTLLDLIRNFVFVREERGKATKVIARYMQYRAANQIVNRVLDNLEGKEEKNSGLIWHWQGSGKTLTMIFAAYKLFNHNLLQNPTVFFILDRTDLEKQLSDEFSALDLSLSAERLTSIKKLKETLLHDSGRGKRGIFLTLIQKFRNEELRDLEKVLKNVLGEETITERKNVIAFVDEGHRTQYGTLASEMRNILANAFFFAFTGTPIAKRGRDTYGTFSYPPDEVYLDKYFITDALRDGFTVKICFQPRLEKKVHLDKDKLNLFLEQKLEEIPEELREDVERKISEKLNIIKVYMKKPGRIELIANDIAEHFTENVDGKFKAMVVAVDRESCVNYKNALDKLLPPEYSEVVMTYTERDSKEIADYLSSVREKYHKKDPKEINEEIRTKFNEEEYPKILIVTDMLLTGFDAPILQVMYLDKPLKEHRLLQAIARTNRPYKDVKEAGIVIDYVGIFKELERAFAIYAIEDVEGAVYDLGIEKKEFLELMEEALSFFNGLDRSKDDHETLNRSIERLTEGENGKKFVATFKKLQLKFELLGAEPIKAQHLRDFKWLTTVYYAYYRHVKRIDPDEVDKYAKKYLRKTIDYIHKSIDIGKIKKDFPIIPLDENYIEKLEKTYSDIGSRISDMIFTLRTFVLARRTENPVYETIAEKVERIIEDWKERKESAEKIYGELKGVFKDLNTAIEKQKSAGLTNLEYYSFLFLKEKLSKETEEDMIKCAKSIVEETKEKRFKGWTLQTSVVREVGRIIRTHLIKYKLAKNEKEALYGKLMENLKRFA
ncbi:MAG: HsdR family type I site-specific deoxyribonuclease [Halobacteriota archaeon]